MKVQFAKACLDLKEIKAVNEVMRSGWLTQGRQVAKFEEKFAEYVGAKYAVAVNSCTSALFLTLKYLSPIGTKVVVPSLTFTASASVIKHAGYKPQFTEVCKEDFCMNRIFVDSLLYAAEDTTNAVISVHLTGNKADTNFCRPVHVIEDCAHRIERNMQGDNPMCFSFYATKNMTTGEGGMITTNDEKMYDWLKLARLHGCTKDGFRRYSEGQNSWEYTVEFTGYKMNMTDIAAAIGLEQLKKLDWMNEKRQKIVKRYNSNLGLKRTGKHLYPVRVIDRERFMQNMARHSIQCSVHFLPLHQMPAYAGANIDLPITHTLGRELVSLPLHPLLTNEEIDYVSKKVLATNLLLQE